VLNLSSAAGHHLREWAFVASDASDGTGDVNAGRRIQSGTVLEWGAVVSGMVFPFAGWGWGHRVVIGNRWMSGRDAPAGRGCWRVLTDARQEGRRLLARAALSAAIIIRVGDAGL
jgi:hypothetical protein